jgi:ATP-dependent RNA helicase MSS116
MTNNQRNKEAELIRKEAQARHEQALKDPTLLTNVRFQERDDIHSASKRAITEIMGLQSMTEIQSKTYAEVLAGQSVLARARTGTGKTLAFLLPSLERILANRLYVPGQSIGTLIVCPTRELAMQIADQARDLLSFHSDDLSVLCLYGGTKMAKDVGLLNNKLPTFLICTPGRLVDHLSGTRLRGRKFSDIMADTGILVLDESDRLVGSFPREMKKITSFLPRSEKRQTLLFSATLPKRMMKALEEVLPDDYAVIDCIAKDNIQAETNLRAEQSYVEVKCMENYVNAFVAILIYFLEEEKELEHKIIVFFPTARLVKFFAQLFSVGIQKRVVPIFEMHSKMSQSARNKISNSFRGAKQGILFTTDISARGTLKMIGRPPR